MKKFYAGVGSLGFGIFYNRTTAEKGYSFLGNYQIKEFNSYHKAYIWSINSYNFLAPSYIQFIEGKNVYQSNTFMFPRHIIKQNSQTENSKEIMATRIRKG